MEIIGNRGNLIPTKKSRNWFTMSLTYLFFANGLSSIETHELS
jgi:hypothetical protein